MKTGYISKKVTTKTLEKRNLKTKHSFHFKDSKMLVNKHNKSYWKIVEI